MNLIIRSLFDTYLLDITQHVILAADYSKFERRAMVEQGHISQVDCLVCDKTPPQSINKIIKENNITFVKA